jgi:proteic killer suppression protein
MIKSFRDDQTKSIFDGQKIRRLDQDLVKKTRRRLEYLNAAKNLEDLFFPPSNKFHALKGVSPARYAISVDSQWRITFEWHNGDAQEVFFEDYH